METFEPVSPAYAAGLFDGEGCIAIHATQRKGEKLDSRGAMRHIDHVVWKARVFISNTNLEVLQRVQAAFGGSVTQAAPEAFGGRNTKRSYVLTFTHSVAEVFLAAVLPHMIVKRKQAELFLEFRSNIQPVGRRPIPREVVWRRHEIYLEMIALNQRGLSTRAPTIPYPHDWPGSKHDSVASLVYGRSRYAPCTRCQKQILNCPKPGRNPTGLCRQCYLDTRIGRYDRAEAAAKHHSLK